MGSLANGCTSDALVARTLLNYHAGMEALANGGAVGMDVIFVQACVLCPMDALVAWMLSSCGHG